mmetsp:Transcript_17229/g.26666  ORF Transcript_17229/g.26666 Transcript_17229/m.26666 type:complete len:278 (+) Transcript_17229:313-1146(+)
MKPIQRRAVVGLPIFYVLLSFPLLVSSFLVEVVPRPSSSVRLLHSPVSRTTQCANSKNCSRNSVLLYGSFFDDLFNGGGKKEEDKNQPMLNEEQLSQMMPSSSSKGKTAVLQESRLKREDATSKEDEDNDEEEEISLEAFQAEMAKRTKGESSSSSNTITELDDFGGYDMRDAILEKWGFCFDLDFNRVDSFGFRNLYLNVMPFRLGSKRFRHKTEMDYLCHLQAIVEILMKYDQLEYVLYQIEETKKKPRGSTSPLIAVPLRLNLTPEQVKDIMGY